MKSDDVRPKIDGRADFYSWQLYKWLEKFPKRTNVYRDSEGRLFIGGQIDSDGFCHGVNLRELCCMGKKIQSWAFPPSYTIDFKDFTDEFWLDYKARGVCAIHGDFAHQWTIVNPELRECDFCGVTQSKTIKIVHREVWV